MGSVRCLLKQTLFVRLLLTINTEGHLPPRGLRGEIHAIIRRVRILLSDLCECLSLSLD